MKDGEYEKIEGAGEIEGTKGYLVSLKSLGAILSFKNIGGFFK